MGSEAFSVIEWLLEEKGLMKEVGECWKNTSGSGSNGRKLLLKLKAVKHHMKVWWKASKGQDVQLKVCESELKNIEQ